MKAYQVSRVLVFGDGSIHRVPLKTFAVETEAREYVMASQRMLETMVLSLLVDAAEREERAVANSAERLVAALGIKQVHTVVDPVNVEGEERRIHVPRLVVPH